MSETNEYGAIGPLTGFIYQEYYFLYRLLTILDGETVSLEKVDDVGVEEGDRLIYYQLKHSVNSKALMKCQGTGQWHLLKLTR